MKSLRTFPCNLWANLFLLTLFAPWTIARSFAADIVSYAATNRFSLSGGGDSTAPIFSADGRVIAFHSSAENLVTNDHNGIVLDVFVRDLSAGVTFLASVNRSGNSGGNARSWLGALSADAKWLAFTSEASDLVASDTNGQSDVFVRDLTAGSTTLVSVNRDGTGAGNGSSSNPALSADGRFIVFESDASNLAPGDANGVTDIFLRDLRNGTTTLVSVESTGGRSGNDRSTSPVISPDGRYVAFVSKATNLVDGVTNVFGEVYVRDLQAGKTIWASAQATNFLALLAIGRVPLSASYNPALSADGRFVVFKTAGTDTRQALIFRHELSTGQTLLVSSNAFGSIIAASDFSGPMISSDAQVIAFESRHTNSAQHVISVWNAATQMASIASVNTNGTVSTSGNSDTPVLSADGRYVAFLSTANDLVRAPVGGSSQIYVRDLTAQTTQVVSAGPNGEAVDHGDLTAVSLSADGRAAAFHTRAGGLVLNDSNDANDVFARNLATGSLQLVSERHPARPSLTGSGFSSFSSNPFDDAGRYFVFTSSANNLVPNDTNGFPDIFVRDRQNGTNLAVTVSADGTSTAAGFSRDPVISRTGRFVAFSSLATNLVGNDTNGREDVFIRDLRAGKTLLASLASDGQSSASGASSMPSLSADERYVVFQSTATNLVAGLALLNPNLILVYHRDLENGQTTLVSVSRDGLRPGNGDAVNPLISPDGRFVSFQSRASDLVATNLTAFRYRQFVRDLVAQKTYVLPAASPSSTFVPNPAAQSFSTDSRFLAYFTGFSAFLCDLSAGSFLAMASALSAPSLSSNALWLAFEFKPGPSTFRRDVALWNRDTQTSLPVNRPATGIGEPDASALSPVISLDGRFVLFASSASNLVLTKASGFSGIYLYDRLLGQITLLTKNLSGTAQADLPSTKALFSPNGRFVAIQSFASDLTSQDFNQASDIFILELGRGDTDNDGMDDAWEVTYFSDTSRDGNGDFDHDGVSDREEFKAGTNPINNASIFRALSVTGIAGGRTTVVWNSIPGRTYQVQFKDDLAVAGWTALEGSITATETTASKQDENSPGRSQRFYRVVQLD